MSNGWDNMKQSSFWSFLIGLSSCCNFRLEQEKYEKHEKGVGQLQKTRNRGKHLGS